MDTPASLEQLVTGWLAELDSSVAAGDSSRIANLFAAESYVRDLLALTWQITTIEGPTAIGDAWVAALDRVHPRSFSLRAGSAAPARRHRVGVDVVEAFVSFVTDVGPCCGVLRLVPDGDRCRAWVMSTALEQIDGHEERIGDRRPSGEQYSRGFGGPNWLDLYTERSSYDDREPTVLVVGAGQAGLAVAARLGRLGIDALVIDRHEHIGDVWRKRYHSLTLHNQTWVAHLPYLPFPESWPTYIPKDMLAAWFEAYAAAMELSVWSSTELVAATYDEASSTWSATVRRKGEGTRIVRPRHIVMATGVSGIPSTPDVPGLADFDGSVVHSSQFTAGADYAGQDVVVVGSGNSAHDVAQDLAAGGARSVTMIQRSPTTVVSIEPSQIVFAHYREGLSTADADLVGSATPYPLLVRSYRQVTEYLKECDAELIDRLNAAGFATDWGTDETGPQMKYLRRGGGYYVNVGCSDLIIAGAVDVLAAADVERIVQHGLRLADGSVRPADAIVLATGYRPQQELVRSLFGSEVADAVGPIWGFGDEGELRNVWTPTAQPGLWFHLGSLTQSRIYSKTLALQIVAIEAGILDPEATARRRRSERVGSGVA